MENSKDDIIKRLLDKSDDLELDLDKANKKIDKLTKENEKLKKEYQTLKEDYDKMSKKHDEMQRENVQMSIAYGKLKEKVENNTGKNNKKKR